MDERFGADRGRRDAGNVGVRPEWRRRRNRQRWQRLQRRHQDAGQSRRRHEEHGDEAAGGKPELEQGHDLIGRGRLHQHLGLDGRVGFDGRVRLKRRVGLDL